jgi:hypothetical protein
MGLSSAFMIMVGIFLFIDWGTLEPFCQAFKFYFYLLHSDSQWTSFRLFPMPPASLTSVACLYAAGLPPVLTSLPRHCHRLRLVIKIVFIIVDVHPLFPQPLFFVSVLSHCAV